MKQRFLSFLLLVGILCMTVTTGVFAKEAPSLDILNEFNRSYQDADSVSMYMVLNMDMEAAGEKMTIGMEGTVSQIIRSQTDIDMEMDMTTSMLGMEIPMTIYYKDGVYYQNAGEEKTKMTMPFEQVMNQMNLGSLNMDMNFPETAIISQEVTETDEGTEYFVLLDGAELSDLLNEQLGSMSELLGEQPEMTFGDVEVYINVDENDVPVSIEMVLAMDMTVEEENVSLVMDMYIEIIQIGGVTIEFPDDLDSYTEQEI